MKQFCTRLVTAVFLCICFSGFAQATTKITLLNSTTNQPVAFANIIFNNKVSFGTISDIDGVFSYHTKQVHTLTISFIGYQTLTIATNQIKNNTVYLEEAVNTLEEVVVNPGENPALAIIRKAIANRDSNNPENLNSFTFKSYNKIIVLPQSTDTVTTDSLNKYFGDKHLFITETVSKRKYLKPKMIEDSIIATRFSGLKKPYFALLATDFQPFSFYNNYFELSGINFLNPISNGSINKYDFKLEEKLLKDNDTIFAISFKPQADKNFDGLKGIMYINSNRYAVQNIEATPADKLKIEIKIQQQYTFIENKYWFPEQLNFELGFHIGSEDLTLKYIGKSYLSDIKTEVPLKKKDFAFENTVFERNIVVKDSAFWAANRNDTLNFKEQTTYHFLDSLGAKHNFDRTLEIVPNLMTGRIPYKFIDIDLLKIYNYNKYEKSRLGLGLYTNDKLIKNTSFGGYAGYGFNDHTWKYGFEATTKLPTKRDIAFTAKYENDLREVGVMPLDNTKMYNSIGFIAENMDHIENISFQTDMKVIRNFYWKFNFSKTKVTPLYDYAFINQGNAITQYNNTTVTANLKYFFKEKVTTFFGKKIQIPGNQPILSLTYSRGLKDVLNGDFNYNKLRFTMDHTFKIRNLGTSTYRLDAGYLDSAVPYGLLFTGDGVYDKNVPLFIPNFFQTVRPYEFVTDRYASLFTTHNFGGLLFKAGKFQPGIVLHNNIGIGNLKNPELHQGIEFKTKSNVLLETGLEVNNILKLNYLNVAYIGFGAGVFYRYGPNALPDTGDNFAFKLTYNLTFK